MQERWLIVTTLLGRQIYKWGCLHVRVRFWTPKTYLHGTVAVMNQSLPRKVYLTLKDFPPKKKKKEKKKGFQHLFLVHLDLYMYIHIQVDFTQYIYDTGVSDGERSTCNAGDLGFNPWVGKIPWKRAWQQTSVFLPGESSWTEEPGGLQSISSVQFSSVVQSCLILCDPMDCSTPGLPVHHQLPELAQTHVYQVSDAIQPFYPLSSIYVLYMDTYIQSMYDTICTSTQVHRSCYHSIICIIIPSEVDRLFPQTFIPLT